MLGSGTPGDGTITLAKMADLAQDTFIVRTTASTGVPETATVTAAARTVLDDTTVAAMLATMGGVAGVGSYKIEHGTTGLTGTATVPTSLTTVVSVIATCKTDISLALCGCSASVGDQAGSPAAGSFYLKTWKHTSSGNCTEVAATVVADVQWVAIGT
jgi:hypothetical protein